MAPAVVPTRVYVQSSLTNGEMKISATSLIIAVSFCSLRSVKFSSTGIISLFFADPQ